RTSRTSAGPRCCSARPNGSLRSEASGRTPSKPSAAAHGCHHRPTARRPRRSRRPIRSIQRSTSKTRSRAAVLARSPPRAASRSTRPSARPAPDFFASLPAHGLPTVVSSRQPRTPVTHELEGLMLILAVGSAVAIGAKRLGVAYNVALVLVGLVVAVLGVLPRAALDPEVVLVGMLPVLVFQGALSTDLDHLKESRTPILALAIPGVALSLLGTAAVATWALARPVAIALGLGALLAIPGVALALLGTAAVATWALELPFAIALVLGALLAITDTVSVLLAFRAVRVPTRLAAIMEGESLFNDGTALVLVATTASIAI